MVATHPFGARIFQSLIELKTCTLRCWKSFGNVLVRLGSFLSIHLVFTALQYVDAGVFPASGHLENLLPFPVEFDDRPHIQEVYPLVPEGLPMLQMLKQHSKAYPPPLAKSNPEVSFPNSNVRLPPAAAIEAIKKLNPITLSDLPKTAGPGLSPPAQTLTYCPQHILGYLFTKI